MVVSIFTGYQNKYGQKIFFDLESSIGTQDGCCSYLKNQITIILNDIKDLKQNLQKQIDDIRNKLFGQIVLSSVATIHTDTSIKDNYILYIKKYGVPEDGIFDPVLLAEF